MTKLCNACGEEPRMVSKSGKTLTMCAGCQRDYWANQKAAQAAQTTRFCKVCQTNKPAAQFGKRSRACLTCTRQRLAAEQQPRETRICHTCKAEKPVSEFRRQGAYRQALCIPCYDARKAEQKRRKAEALPQMERLRVRGSAPLENGYPDGSFPTRAPLAGGVLLVDRERGQVILTEVLSEIPTSARQIEHLVAFFAARGYRIVDSVEREAVLS